MVKMVTITCPNNRMQAHHCTKLVQRVSWRSLQPFVPVAAGSDRKCEKASTRPSGIPKHCRGTVQHCRSRSVFVMAAQQQTTSDQVRAVTFVSTVPSSMVVHGVVQTAEASSLPISPFHCLQAFIIVGSGRVGTAFAKLGNGCDVRAP